MSLSISSVNNEAAVAQSYTKVGADRVSSEWQNTTTSDADTDMRVIIKHQQQGKTSYGVSLQRHLVQVKYSQVLDPVSTGINGSEDLIVNLTIQAPKLLTDASQTQVKDCVAFIRNWLTATVVGQLLRNEV